VRSELALYELAGEYHRLIALADTDELPAEVIRDTLEGLTGEIEIKSVNIAKFILSLEAQADAITAAAKQMNVRAQRVRNRADSIRAYLLFQMQATGTTKVTCPEFTLARRSNPPAVGLREGVELPPEYMTTPEPPPPFPDKRKIAEALKAGKEIDGAWLEQGERLEIKA
jgi:Gp157 protein